MLRFPTALCLHATRNEGSRSRTPLPCPLPSLAWLVPCSHWHTQPSPTGSHFGSPRSSITGRGHQHSLLRVLVCINVGVYNSLLVQSFGHHSPFFVLSRRDIQALLGWLVFVSAIQAVGSTARSSGSATMKWAPL